MPHLWPRYGGEQARAFGQLLPAGCDGGRDALNQRKGAGGEACEVFADLCVDAPAAEAALGLDRAARRRIQERLQQQSQYGARRQCDACRLRRRCTHKNDLWTDITNWEEEWPLT